MSYQQLKDLLPAAFHRVCGVKPETFGAMLEVLKTREGHLREGPDVPASAVSKISRY